MLETVFPASFCSSSAHAPETWGAAIEVPLLVSNPPPGMEELMPTPGARRSTREDMLELEAMLSPAETVGFAVEPTVIALEMHAGAPTAFVKELLPDEITVAALMELRLSMAALRASVSQALVKLPPPRLMFTAEKVKSSRSLRSKTCSRVAIWSLLKVVGQGSSPLGSLLQAFPVAWEKT